MRPYSAFDGIMPLAHVVPSRVRLAAMTAAIDGAGASEGEAKSVASFDISDDALAVLKAVCLVVQSAELAGGLSDVGVDFLVDQLRIALGPVTDARFFGAILTGVSPAAASGSDASAFRADVAAALKSLGLGQNSKPAIIVDPAQAVDLSFAENGDGSTAFLDMSLHGGTVGGAPVFVSSGIPLDDATSPALRQVIVLDCQGLAVDPGEVVLSPGSSANVTIDGQTSNLWQDNAVGLLAERTFGAAVVRSGAVAAISGSYSTGTETSP
jgi:hypothetical protein